MNELIVSMFDIHPETGLEREICEDEDIIEGMMWGEPRSGHPEGEVGWHVRDVLENIDRWYGDDPDRERLRLAALVHDTFKCEAKLNGQDHARVAAGFLEKYSTDKVLLTLVALHDEPYRAFRNRHSALAQARLGKIKKRMGPDISLLVKFYRCDSLVKGKKTEPYGWFTEIIAKS
ncbi:MAG: HD domain-containing protein [bacterium]|nr:HD domain-containing protein [bacterium]